MSTAKEGALRFDAVADDPAPAVVADRRQLVDRAFEAVEHVAVAGRDHLEREIVVVPAHLALRHRYPRTGEPELDDPFRSRPAGDPEWAGPPTHTLTANCAVRAPIGRAILPAPSALSRSPQAPALARAGARRYLRRRPRLGPRS